MGNQSWFTFVASAVFEDTVFVGDAVFGVKLFSRVGMSYYFGVAQDISTLEKVKTYAERGYS